MISLSAQVKREILDSGIIVRICQHGELDSTMTEAARLIFEDSAAAVGTLILTESQTLGRGRMGHIWHSPRGGLYSSIIFPEHLADSFSLVSALAVAEAVEGLLNLKTRIAWPNDIILMERKFGGVLLENILDCSVLGFGVNSFSPVLLDPALKRKAISIEMSAEGRGRLLCYIVAVLASHYTTFKEYGFAPFKKRFESKLYWLGQKITLSSGDFQLKGILGGVNESGGIVIEESNGRRFQLDNKNNSNDIKIEEISE